jgi:hypothetical protein
MQRTTWDRYRQPNDHDDPYAAYGAWERWMEAEDDRGEECGSTLPSIMPCLEGMSARINLYSRFCDAAYGNGIPWHRRLWDVLTEPVVKARWKFHQFRHDLRRDLHQCVRSIRAGRWPRRTEGGSWVLYRPDPGTGLPTITCYRGAFAWERAIPWSYANRRRRAAIRAMEARKTEGATS